MHAKLSSLIFPSIKRNLLFWLLLFLLPVLMITTARSYLSVQYFTNSANDQSLFNVALSLSNSLEADHESTEYLDEVMAKFKDYVELNHFYYLILNDKRQRLHGNLQLTLPAQLPHTGHKVFFDANFNQEKLRVVVFNFPSNVGHRFIIVGETFHARDDMERNVFLVFLVSQIVIICLVLIALNLSINRGLIAFERFRNVILARKPSDTYPIEATEVPEEMQSIVSAMNDLLIRIKKMVDHKQQFIANASHQLKTPLAGLKVQVESVLNEQDPTRVRQALMQMLNSTDKLTRLNSQLLSLARVEEENKQQEIRLKPIDLVELVHQVVAEWVPNAMTNHMDLGIEAENKQIIILGNDLLIAELLNNLVDNALAYNPEGTRITVKLIQHENLVKLIVEDNGAGIPIVEQEKVFQRFYRTLGNSQTNGCGLGMAIVAEVMHLHQGKSYVTFNNLETQSGTSVVCEFPL